MKFVIVSLALLFCGRASAEQTTTMTPAMLDEVSARSKAYIISSPYGMSKEEFGAFIEEHVRAAMKPQVFQPTCYKGNRSWPAGPDGQCGDEDMPK